MPLAVRKAHHLVFDGRAIARTNAADFSAVQGGATDIRADDFVCFFICIDQMAGNHGAVYTFVLKTKGNDFRIARLFFKRGKIDCVAQDARRRSRLEAASGKAKPVK